MKRSLRRLSILLALLSAGQGIAQRDEGAVFFSVSTSRTFGPGEQPEVRVWAQGVSRLQFRLYRVNDPVAFFDQLENPQRFGGQPHRPARRLTPIERFHRWKLESRQRLRNAVRSQFTKDARDEIKTWNEPPARPRTASSGKTSYADIPLLNPQQVLSVWEQPVLAKQRWESSVVKIPAKEKGLYLVEATNGELQAYTIVSITNLAIISKSVPGRVVARVVDRTTGEPVANCPLWLKAGPERRTLNSDADGLIDAKLTMEAGDSILLLARTANDLAGAGFFGSFAGEAQLKGYVYTDRPVYRPGHTVHYKAVFRAENSSGYALPTAQSIDLNVDDPEGKTILHRQLKLSSFGSSSGELTLPQGAALGQYGMRLSSGESYMSGSFYVEEYKKPEYEVKVKPSEPRLRQGVPVKAVIEARYYFGEPVKNAKVTYVVHRSRYWPPYSDDDEEAPGEEEEQRWGSEQIVEQSGRLNEEGRLEIQFENPAAEFDQVYRIEARVTDAAGREIPGTGYLIATVGDFRLQVRPSTYVASAGDTGEITVEALDYNGKPVADLPVTASIGQNGSDGNPRPTYESVQGRTGADGKVKLRLPLRGGSLRIAASAPSAGRQVMAETWMWVTGEGFSYGPAREQIELVTDKPSYRSGEKVKLLVVSPAAGMPLWLTVEGRDLHQSITFRTQGNTKIVELPVKAGFVPNFFVTAVGIRGNQLFQGAKSIKVPPVSQELSVDVRPDRQQYTPGQTATYRVTAKDNAGRPVAAEVSLGLVDEAIYAIHKDSVPDPVKFFYGTTYNHIFTSTSLSYSFYGEAGKRRMRLARMPVPARAIIKPDKFVDPRVRKAFPDTALWVADLITGKDGTAQTKVEFPDALTTWRATARAFTVDTKVGMAIDRTIVRKNLIVRMGAPRFFTEGDEIVVPVIVHNYLTGDKNARLSLSGNGFERLSGETMDVRVPPGGEAHADFRIRVNGVGEAVLLAKALTNEESDAIELTLPVRPFGTRMTEAGSGSLSISGAQTEKTFQIPASSSPGSRKLQISVAPSVAGPVFDALEYLTSYPYGCTEQTMSSFLPNVIVSQALQGWKIQTGINAAELRKKIDAGWERLSDFQHDDGGWGWWKTDDSDLFMTAYVVSGLQQARAAGYSLDDIRLQKAVAWLQREMQSGRATRSKRGDYPDLQAYALRVLAEAGAARQAWLDDAWRAKSEMSPYGLALLGLAARSLKDGRSAQIAQELERQMRTEGDEVWWPMSRDTLMDLYVDASAEATAHVLKFLVQEQPKSPLLEKAASWLVNHRSDGFFWSSTKQTAMVVYGLIDYLRLTGELHPDLRAEVAVNGTSLQPADFRGQTASLRAVTLEVPAGQIRAGSNTVKVTMNGSGRLYWSYRADAFAPDAPRQAGNTNLKVDREYFRLTPEHQGERILYALEPAGQNWQPGDIIAVHLRVSGAQARYLMIEDPIPAGTEGIERDDLYQWKRRPDWWSYWFTRRELRDDRAVFFQTYLPDAPRDFFYLLKVVQGGRMKVSSTRVEPMYQPGIYAASETAVVEVP